MHWAHNTDCLNMSSAPLCIISGCLWLIMIQKDSETGPYLLALLTGGRRVHLFFTLCLLNPLYGWTEDFRYGTLLAPMIGGLRSYAVSGICSLTYSLKFFCGGYMQEAQLQQINSDKEDTLMVSVLIAGRAKKPCAMLSGSVPLCQSGGDNSEH